MSDPTPATVDELLDTLLLEDDSALAARGDSAAAGLPPIEVSPQAAHFLACWIRDRRRSPHPESSAPRRLQHHLSGPWPA